MHHASGLLRCHTPLRFTFLSLLAGLALTGCKTPAPEGAANDTPGTVPSAKTASTTPPYTGSDILLGQFGSLTGTTATFGISTDNGVKMAIDEANAKGGALGKKIRVVTVDDGSKTDQAASAALRLINREKVLAIIGEVASSRSLAAAPVCQKAGVPMISPASTNPAVTQTGDYVFRTCFIDPFQGTVVAKFARDQLKAKRIAILTDSASDYSKGLTQYFTEEWKRGGGEIVSEVSYSEGDKDFRAQLTTIKGQNPDVIFVPGYYTEVGNLAVQARSLGLKQPLLGGDGWDSDKLYEISKGALEGSYYSNHYSAQDKSPRVANFVAAYKKRFGGKTPDVMAALGYDATLIMVDAIKRAGSTDRAKIRDAIAATKNFEGVTGNITLDKNRDAIKSAVILQVKGNSANYVTTIKP
jgi:branched-chain amino acid transport system substrate-binding protein